MKRTSVASAFKKLACKERRDKVVAESGAGLEEGVCCCRRREEPGRGGTGVPERTRGCSGQRWWKAGLPCNYLLCRNRRGGERAGAETGVCEGLVAMSWGNSA